jgi:magnesium chelatase subunit D
LALGIEAAWQMAAQVRRLGASPLVVMLTDGRANIDRSGQPGRAQAQSDALRAARQLRLDRVTTLLIDTSPQAAAAGSELAVAMGAHYRALPYAAAHQLRHTVQSLAQELSA